MADPVLHGPAYSTYARSARLALEEKGVPYKLEEVDILAGQGQAPEHLARHPFGKVPSFTHDGFSLYETGAITRYIDEAFPGAKLQPSDLRRRARMNQIIGIVDAYAYDACILKLFIQRVVQPMKGGSADEGVIREAIPKAAKSIDALEALADPQGPFLVGDSPTLADFHLAPVIEYANLTPEGKKLMAGAPRLSRWWVEINKRPSVAKTKPALG